MNDVDDVRYRIAEPHDALQIGQLHADSWRRHYRGAYSDSYLDGDVVSEREGAWTQRMTAPASNARTLVAEADGGVIGFAHLFLGEDATYGSLLENLHVRSDLKRHGVGTQLMVRAASIAVEAEPTRGMYLWVLEQNVDAQAFYNRIGGEVVERALAPAPGGDPTRLNGAPYRLRVSWPDPRLLGHDA